MLKQFYFRCFHPAQSGPGSNGIEEALHITQSSSITKVLKSDGLAAKKGHTLAEC